MRAGVVRAHDATTTTTTTAATTATQHDDDDHHIGVEDARVCDASELGMARVHVHTSRVRRGDVNNVDDSDSDDSDAAAGAATPTFMPSRRHHSFFSLDNHATAAVADVDNDAAAAGVLPYAAHDTSRHGVVDKDTHDASAQTQQQQQQQPLHNSNDDVTVNAAVAYDYQRSLLRRGRRCRALPLFRLDQVPPWQRFNPHIRSGYRAYYSTTHTLHSLLGWHNESVNVWSHLLGVVVFAVLSMLLLLLGTLASTATARLRLSSSTLVYALYCAGCTLCMLSSTVYHLFNGHRSHRLVVATGRLDFIGITLLIVCSFLPPLYVLLQCNPLARRAYMTLIVVAGCGGVVAPWTDAFYRHLWLRTGVYASMACSGVAPVVHILYVLPHTTATMQMLSGVLLMTALYVAGLVFYISHFPESHFAGHFDCVLSSHQLWHAFVLLAALVHYCNAIGIYQTWAVIDDVC